MISLLCCASAFAVNTELGVNYSYKKSAFDSDNNSEQQSTTGSVSFYFWERVALETSYTSSLYVKKEKQPAYANAFLRTTTQYTDVYGADLIFIFADRKAPFQPYIKAGAAQVKVRQVVQDTGADAWEITYNGLSPSAGVGLKFFLTEAFAVRASYDAIQTPVNNDTKVTDVTGRIGISWML
jgi:hypothetical protein